MIEHLKEKKSYYSDKEKEFYKHYIRFGLSDSVVTMFHNIIYQYYYHVNHERNFQWRTSISPYNVVVSEIMLQQTQTSRVVEKFKNFIAVFPDFKSLADAPFDQVLIHWKGLGYNRRAIYLQKIASIITYDFAGVLPADPNILKNFPGLGHATASSIAAFSYNIPTVFIETNIRSVYIYFFYGTQTFVSDKDLLCFIEKTLDKKNSRQWYYALMDYGVMLKKTVGNICKQSKHYNKQSKFEGSDRQIRGKILGLLLDKKVINIYSLPSMLNTEEERIACILNDLIAEKFIVQHGHDISLVQFI